MIDPCIETDRILLHFRVLGTQAQDLAEKAEITSAMIEHEPQMQWFLNGARKG